MNRIPMLLVSAALVFGASSSAKTPQEAYHLIPGSVPMDKGPDGNSIFLDAPKGLIVVDTGRHPEHAQQLLDYAKERGRPIAAIVNTHWHLDHTTGNADIRAVYPSAQVYATTAIEGALKDFLNKGKEQAEKRIADPKAPPDQRAQLIRGRSRIDNPDTLRPTVPVTKSATMKIAGRKLEVHVAPFAATEADLWLYDPATRVVIVGDLVVGIVPFMDTACPDGWKKALEEVAATPFVTLIPGHGAPMSRAQFLQWKQAYDNFVDCGHSARLKEECVAGWKKDAAPFIDAERSGYVIEAAEYYLDTRLRSLPEEQQKYCKALGS